MSIRIKVSYTEEKELAGVIRLLSPVLKVWKKSKKREGRYKNAYAVLELGTKPEGTREKGESGESDTELRAKPGGITGNGKEGRYRIRGSPEEEARPSKGGKTLV